MCRDKLAGGRRCPHDGSEARRVRRQNAKLKIDFADEVVETEAPHLITVDENSNVVENSNITEIVEAVTACRDTLDKYKSYSLRKPEVNSYADYHALPVGKEEVEAEQVLVKLGKEIEDLSNMYGAPKEEEWDKLFLEQTEFEEGYLSEQEALRDKMSAILGVKISSSQGRRFIDLPSGGIYNEIVAHREEESRLLSMGETPETNEFLKAAEELRESDVLYQVNKQLHAKNFDGMITKRRDAYLQALQSVGVEFAGTDDLEFKSLSQDKGNDENLKYAGSLYPKSWIESSNTKLGALKVRSEAARANYDHMVQTINISRDEDTATVVHELAHRMEYANPEVSEAERRFLSRRSGWTAYHNKELKKKPAIATVRSGASEWGYKDNFAVAYIGRVYDYRKDYVATTKRGITIHGDRGYEVLSMGMESTFFGKYGAGIGADGHNKDKEHIHFVLGVLASSAK